MISLSLQGRRYRLRGTLGSSKTDNVQMALFPYVGQNLLPSALRLAAPFDQSGDVDNFTVVGTMRSLPSSASLLRRSSGRNDADVGFDGAKRKVAACAWRWTNS